MSKVKVRVGDVSYINANNFDFKDKESINYLDTGSITNNIIDGYKTLNTNEKIPSRAKRAVNENTIVYSSVRPKLCHFGILHNLPKNAVVSTGFITLDAKPIIEPYYLYNCITTNDKINYISKIADTSVSSYPSINPSDLADMEIEIEDDFIKQKMISDLLINIDKKVENNNKIISELESLAKTIYDYWFLQFEFPNEEGKPYKSSGGKMVWNEELKRKIPEGWIISDLSSCIKVIRGVSYDKDEISLHPIKGYVPLLKSNNVQNNKILYEDLIYVSKNKVNVDQTLNQNSILITMSSGSTEHVGKTALCSYDNTYTYGAFCSKISINPFCRCFLSMFFTTDYFKNKIRTIVVGTNIKNISNSHLTDNRIPFPSKNVLSKFENTVTPLLDKRAILVKENQELASLRDFLLPMLMNGQVTFKEEDE